MTVTSAIVVILTGLVGWQADVNLPSEILSPETKETIARVVTQKYSLPQGTKLAVMASKSGIGTFGAVTVQSLTPGRPFEKQLLVTSDGHFVVEMVGELGTALVQSEQRHEAEVVKRLAEGDAPRLGADSAPVKVVMFTDLQCGFCREAVKTLRDRILVNNPGTEKQFPGGIRGGASDDQ